MAARGEKTTYYQRLSIVEWLEDGNGDNFRLITGDGQGNYKTVVAGAKLKKKDAYEELAIFVNQQRGCKWTSKQADSRFKAYVKMYKDVKRAVADGNGEKYCIGPADLAKGVTTLEQKKEQDCPLYERMDLLFGSRQNVIPSHVMEGAPPLEDSDSEDEEEGLGLELFAEDELAELVAIPAGAAVGTINALIANAKTPPAPSALVVDKKRAAPHSAISAELSALTQESVNKSGSNELADKIASIKKGKKDFGTAYSDSQSLQLGLQRDKFTWEKGNYAEEQRSKAKIHEEDIRVKEKSLQEDTKCKVMIQLIQSGKSADEIKAYLALLNM